MKTKITLLLVVCFALTSCSKWYYWHKHHQDDDDGGGNEERQTVEISDTQIIVRFEEGADKQELRDQFGVTVFEPCSCGDTNLELWGIDPNNISIEGAISALRGESRAEGDFQFTFETPRIPSYETIGGQNQLPTGLISFNSNPDIVDIAVLDTGIDFGQEYTLNPFTTQYLYGVSGPVDCPSATGWNFADDNDDVLDDNGHGTFVTKIITNTLDEKGLGYRILPIKLFDDNGQGSYWNVICGFGYLKNVLDAGNNIDVVNASFGGTIENQLFDEEGLLNTMIKELGDEGVLVVTSAGNEGIDTDGGPLKHFPSGYAADNILAVGGHDEGMPPSIDLMSNFGTQSIDLAAPYEPWNITLAGQGPAILDGTSYGTAYATGLISEFYITNGRPSNPVQLKMEFLQSSAVENSPNLIGEIDEGRYVQR